MLSVFHIQLLSQLWLAVSRLCAGCCCSALETRLSASSLQLLLIKISSTPPSPCAALQEQLTALHHHPSLVLPQLLSFPLCHFQIPKKGKVAHSPPMHVTVTRAWSYFKCRKKPKRSLSRFAVFMIWASLKKKRVQQDQDVDDIESK